ncbi:MAG: GntR family transcriptional regulator [Eubacteriales bacterium]|nr:GntR family transcriptional regulator [Eubacteriales bacterium]
MRQPLETSAIYDELKQKITCGGIKSGEYLIEAEIAASHNVSRTPVRQALRNLEDDGLVKIVPRKGTYVKFLSSEDVIEVYQAAEALEGMAIFLIAMNDQRDVKEWRKLNDRMKEALDRHDIVTWCGLDEKFHEMMYECCGNSVIVHLYDHLRVNMRRVRTFYSSLWHDKQLSCHEHERLLNKIEEGDAKGARIIIQNHYRVVLNHASLMLGLETSTHNYKSMPLDDENPAKQ